MELGALGVLRAAGAVPGDNCPLSHCPPVPGDAVDPSCVTGELWLLLQKSLHCLCAECGIDPQRGVRQTSSSCRCREFSCCLSLRKDTSLEALGIRDLPALEVIFGCPVSGAGLGRFGSGSGLIPVVLHTGLSSKVPHSVPCLSSPAFALRTVLWGELGPIVISL